MTNFWENVDGKKENAVSTGFELIPDDSHLVAEIEQFIVQPKDGERDSYYEIKWRILDPEFKNRIVFQKIRAFDQKPEKALRAKNMLMLIHNLFHVKPNHEFAPGNDDLLAFQGKIASIKVSQWHMGDKSGNWVSEVNPSDFVDPASSHGPESALTRHADQKSPVLDEDIPF